MELLVDTVAAGYRMVLWADTAAAGYRKELWADTAAVYNKLFLAFS